ncbi:MAG: hypothetical protein HZC25_18695 [Rhodospirillales bacterium]|nr:hypothetical protein [Rhodospirillales bacterium]
MAEPAASAAAFPNILVVPQGPGYDAERQRMDDLKAQMRAKIAGLKSWYRSALPIAPWKPGAL